MTGRQSSESYPGQGRVPDPSLPDDPTGGRQGRGRAAQKEPKRGPQGDPNSEKKPALKQPWASSDVLL
jgi:hypothetical protein